MVLSTILLWSGYSSPGPPEVSFRPSFGGLRSMGVPWLPYSGGLAGFQLGPAVRASKLIADSGLIVPTLGFKYVDDSYIGGGKVCT